jgi:protein phosphatase
VRAFGISDPGPVRRINEDAFVSDEALALFAVADGMGGHNAGEVASRLALEALHGFVQRSDASTECTWPCGIERDLSLTGNRLKTAVFLANRRVYRAAESHEDYIGMGSTIAGVLLDGERIAVAHVGDSRVYVLRGQDLMCLTADDSWRAAILQDAGMDARKLEAHPLRHVLTNVLGAREATDIHLLETSRDGVDAVLICSDGLHTAVSDAQLEGVLRTEADPEQAARTLVDTALTQGSRDNVTALVVRCASHD